MIAEWLGEDPYIAGRRQGKTDVGALAAGQSSVLIHEVLPAREIIERIVVEADDILVRLGAGR